jgi:hypothetical protein
MFRFNRNKQKTNRNSLIGSIFCYFLPKFRVFLVFSVFSFFFFVFFISFRFASKQFVSVVSLLYQNGEFLLNRNKQKTHPNSVKESRYGNFSENLGLFRFVTKQICLFRLFRYRFHRNKPKFFLLGFIKQTETNAKQILFWFVTVRAEIYLCLFRVHPRHV